MTKVEKPWGHQLIWALSETYCGKVLFVLVRAPPSASSSTTRRMSRGSSSPACARLELGEAGQQVLHEEVVGAGAAFRDQPGTVHRVTAIEDTTILEVSTPQLDDIVRLEDLYGREGTTTA